MALGVYYKKNGLGSAFDIWQKAGGGTKIVQTQPLVANYGDMVLKPSDGPPVPVDTGVPPEGNNTTQAGMFGGMSMSTVGMAVGGLLAVVVLAKVLKRKKAA